MTTNTPQESNISINKIIKNLEKENANNQKIYDVLTTKNKIDELRLKGDNNKDVSLALEKIGNSFDGITKKLSGDKVTTRQKTSAFNELEKLQSAISEIETKRSQDLENQSAQVTSNLAKITQSIQIENEKLRAKMDFKSMEERLKGLNTNVNRLYGNAQIQKDLQESFNDAQAMLSKSIEEGNYQGVLLAQKTLDAISDSIESEEERRESAKLLADQNSTLLGLSNKFDSLSDDFGNFADKAKTGLGIIGGLGAIAALLIDPKMLVDTFNAVIMKMTNFVSDIRKVFEGDEKLLDALSDNIGVASVTLGAISLLFGSNIISGLASVLKGTQALFVATQAFKAFMLVNFIPTATLLFSSMATAFTTAILPILPIVGIISAGLGILYLGFKSIQESLGDGVGVVDTLKYIVLVVVDFLAKIVNAITYIPRKIIEILGPTVYKFLFGKEKSFENFGKLDTNRASKFKEELQSRPQETPEEASKISALPNMDDKKVLDIHKVSADNAIKSKSNGSFDQALRQQAENNNNPNNNNINTNNIVDNSTRNTVITRILKDSDYNKYASAM